MLIFLEFSCLQNTLIALTFKYTDMVNVNDGVLEI